MNVKALFLMLGLALAPLPVAGQGFAGLGATVDEGFSYPQPDVPLVFPEDHGPHPDFRIEWWYLTAVLQGTDGRDYGVQWTLFRSALRPQDVQGWESPQIWMGHAGLTTPEAHFSAERFARDGIGQAGVSALPFAAYIDDWQMLGTAPGNLDPLSALSITARGPDWSYDLDLAAKGPLVPQGQNGFSVKSASGKQASAYYSQPFYEVAGTLTLPSGQVEVTGQGWLDREWSSQPLEATQSGWDWISLHLDTGEKLMGYRLRDRAGGAYTPGTWIAADGTPTPLPDGALRMTPQHQTRINGHDVPTVWRVELESQGLDVDVAAMRPDSWMDTLFPYWEGPVRVTGTHTGVGYLEMTGYDD